MGQALSSWLHRNRRAFLYWLEVRKDKDIVPALNRVLRDGRYSAKLFQEKCGAPLDALWREFVAQSKN